MHRVRLWILICVVISCALGCVSRSQAKFADKSCGILDRPVISDTAIGELRTGRTAAEVHSLCNVLRDTTDLWEEGLPARTLTVKIANDTVTAVMDSDRVDYLFVDSPHLRTRDSLGVGTTLGRLLEFKNVSAIFYEGALHVLVPKRCGLGFRVEPHGPAEGEYKQDWSMTDLRRLDASSPVLSLIVSNCVRVPAPSA